MSYRNSSSPWTTRSGRVIVSPKPKGRITQRLRQIDEWLHAEAVTEVATTGNEAAALTLAGMRDDTGTLHLSDGDRAVIDDCLFGPAFPLPDRSSVVWRCQEGK